MRIVIIGPGMEERQQPVYALKDIDAGQQTPIERKLCTIAQGQAFEGIHIVGVPWVNPKGHGHTILHLDDYLDEPVYLLRAITVALLAVGERHADAVCVVVDDGLRLEEAMQWVSSHAKSGVPLERVKWRTSSELELLCNDLLALK